MPPADEAAGAGAGAAAQPAGGDAGAGLTADEATVYDRQLRVWGVEVQRKLTSARVLIIGFGKLAAEVAKNITLAGVGSVALLDDAPAREHEGRSFLVTCPAAEGVSCAEAAAKTLQAMNPLVKVTSVPGSPADALQDAQLLSSYDLVAVVGAPLAAAAAAGGLCAAAGVKFMAAGVKGWASYYFADLGSHSYKPKGGADASKGGGGGGDQQAHLEYTRLADALATPFAALPPNCHALVPVLLAAAAAERELGRPLTSADAPAAAAALQRLLAAAGDTAAGAAWAAAAAAQLPAWVGAGEEFAPVAAVVGGVMGNDIVRAVSHSDMPTHNTFLYDLSGRPMVQVLPPPGAGAAGKAGAGAAGKAAAAAVAAEREDVEVLSD